MSLRNFFIENGQSGVFQNLDVNNTLNVDGQIILNGTAINPGGSGSQSLSSVLAVGNDANNSLIKNIGSLVSNGRLEIDGDSDCQVVLCPSTAGTSDPCFSIIANTSNLNISSNLFTNSGNLLSLSGDSSSATFLTQNLLVGGDAKVYDEKYNKPALSDVLSASNSANGYNMTDIGDVEAQNIATSGSVGLGQNCPINMYYATGTNTGATTQITTNNSGNVQVNYFSSGTGGTSKNLLSLSNAGVLNVSNGTQVGRVYDDTIYRPPSGGGSSIAVMVYTNSTSNTAPLPSNTNTPINWYNLSTTEDVGTVNIGTSGSLFTNTATTPKVFNFSGFMTLNAGTVGKDYVIYAQDAGLNRLFTSCVTAGVNPINMPFSFTCVMQPSGTITFYAWTDDTTANTLNYQYGARLCIVQLN